MHQLSLEINEVNKKKFYNAKMWPMLNFKELQEFKHVVDDAPTTTTNLAENKMSMNLDGELP
ncbi:LOW QUALITY PROTEIN: hypothetical protein YC2023_081163 [Brassica napus]